MSTILNVVCYECGGNGCDETFSGEPFKECRICKGTGRINVTSTADNVARRFVELIDLTYKVIDPDTRKTLEKVSSELEKVISKLNTLSSEMSSRDGGIAEFVKKRQREYSFAHGLLEKLLSVDSRHEFVTSLVFDDAVYRL